MFSPKNQLNGGILKINTAEQGKITAGLGWNTAGNAFVSAAKGISGTDKGISTAAEGISGSVLAFVGTVPVSVDAGNAKIFDEFGTDKKIESVNFYLSLIIYSESVFQITEIGNN